MKKQLLMIRHNTEHKTYRRAGLCFYQDSQPYEVTAEQLAILKNDPRIVMHEIQSPKASARTEAEAELDRRFVEQVRRASESNSGIKRDAAPLI